MDSTVRRTRRMFAANIGKTKWRERPDQTCGQWHQNVLQRFARTRRDTSCLNPGNWDMIFLLQQTLSAVLWFSIPGTLHTGTSQADLEVLVKKSLYSMAWKKKKRYNTLNDIKWKFEEFLLKYLHSPSP